MLYFRDFSSQSPPSPPFWRAPPGLWFRTEGAPSETTLAKHLLLQMDTLSRPKSISLGNPNTLLVPIMVITVFSIHVICRLFGIGSCCSCLIASLIFKSSMATMTGDRRSRLCLCLFAPLCQHH